jgi:hypothetical protein
VNCAGVRDALPEFALGVAPAEAASPVELHVETCAACRKEAIELQRAVAAFGYALAPSDVADTELEQRVVGAVRDVAVVAPAHGRGSRGRRTGAILLAAAVIVATLGVGVVIANHEARLRLQAQRTAQANQVLLDKFGDVVRSARFADPGTQAYLGMLVSPHAGRGSGSALTIVSPAGQDQMIVIVNDLPARTVPLSVSITNAKGDTIDLGTVRRLDTGGGGTIARTMDQGLAGFVDVIVRDGSGRIVLRGMLVAETAVATPSP